MKFCFALVFSCLLTLGASAQVSLPASHSIYVDGQFVPFFYIPVPVATSIGYEFAGAAPHLFHAAPVFYLRGSEGQEMGLALQYGYLLGRGRHFFEPRVGVYAAYIWDETTDIFVTPPQTWRLRKYAITPLVDLSYRFHFPDPRWYLRAGLSFRTPPLGEQVVVNDFAGDGGYDGPAIRASIRLGVGVMLGNAARVRE
ncbi:MAG: hypothetical protein OHK0039_37290 [Bacteroidia bacterium]